MAAGPPAGGRVPPRSRTLAALGTAERLFGGLVFVFGVLGTLCILFLAGLIIADVIGREAFNRPIAGVAELVAMSMVSIVFLQLGYALRAERMTRNGALLEALCRRLPALGHGLEALFSLVGAAVFAMICYATFPYLKFAWSSGQFFGGMAGFFVPVWPVRAITVAGSAVVTVQFLIRAVRHAGFALAGGRP